MFVSTLAPLLWLAAPAAAAPADVRWTTTSYVNAALEGSPQVGQAREALKGASERYLSDMGSAILPQVSFTANAYPYGDNPANGYLFNTWRLNRSDMSFNTTLHWNLFNSFGDWLKVRVSRLARESTSSDLQTALQAQALEALKDYYDLFLKTKLLDVAKRNLKAQENQYQLTGDLYKHGMKSLSDLLKSETDWRSSELRLKTAEAERRDALLRFNTLLDRDPGEPAELEEELDLGATSYPEVEADLRRAWLQRPELRKSRSDLERSRAQWLQALQSSLPTLSVDTYWNHQDLASFGLPSASFGIPSPNYQVALTLALPLGFNVFSQVHTTLAAKADQRKSAAALEAMRRQVRQDVYSARIQLDQALGSYKAAARKEEISRQDLELVIEQYRQGSADVIKLAQAQLDYIEAQTQRAQVLHDANLNRAQYKLALGEPLWK